MSNSRFVLSMPKDMRGPQYAGLDEWMESVDYNLSVSDEIHQFLMEGTLSGSMLVGFHRMRDQQILFERLNTIGIKKGFFSNGRHFLRNKITRVKSAFRAVLDLVCIHGICRKREWFWNALGVELGPQWHLRSEIQYYLSLNAEPFLELIRNRAQSQGD